MAFDAIPVAETAVLDREIEDGIARVMSGAVDPAVVERLGDLIARRVRLGEPAGFARIETLLGMQTAA